MEWTRRELGRLGALGVGAAVASRLGAQETGQRKIGYCVIGLGRIADHFMRGVKNSSTCRITGVVSGHRDKAEKIAAQYGVPAGSIYSYEDMDRMRENKEIDAVYVALPNGMHAEYTIRSAKAGKHVLCEKPMCTSVTEAHAMIAACKTANVKLMIAYRLHYEPLTLKAVQLVRDGALGEVQGIDGSFGFNIKAGEWRLDKKLAGGGPLMDVGIYVLNAARFVTGEEPSGFKALTAKRSNDGRFKEVEETLTWTMEFPSGILASCGTTYGGQMPGYFKVFGSKGYMEMSPAYDYEGQHLKANYRDAAGAQTLDEASSEHDPMQFQREAEHLAQCIVRNTEPLTSGEEGLRDMEAIRRIYEQVGIKMG